MSAPVKTLAELSIEAQNALYERLGVADTVRYLSQFTNGRGDYTKEREARYANQTVDDLMARIEAKRTQRKTG